jgi:hypothetical protein
MQIENFPRIGKKNSSDVDNAFLLRFLEFVKGHCFDRVFGLMILRLELKQIQQTEASCE